VRTKGAELNQWRRSPGGATAIRYALTSAISVVIGQLTLILAFGVLGWTPRSSNYLAFVVAGVPSYYLNRKWAWGKSGRSHLLKEVLPFWVIALVGLALSTWAVDFVDTNAQAVVSSRALRTVLLMGASMAAFGVVWIGKFLIFKRYLFGPAATA